MGYIDPWQIPTRMLIRPVGQKPDTPKSGESAEEVAQAAKRSEEVPEGNKQDEEP